MGYAAIALAVVGFGLGVTFRFKVLLPVLVLFLVRVAHRLQQPL